MQLSNEEIFAQASTAADNAVAARFRDVRPSNQNAAGDYWQLVFEATAAFLRKHVNGVY